jgi:uncharacterized membrane protein
MQNPPPVQTAAKSSTGLDENIAALLSYVFGWVGGLVFFLIEKSSRLVRFHAMQSILLNVLAAVVGIALWFIWFIATVITNQISGILSTLVSVVLFLVILLFFVGIVIGWVLCLIKAYGSQFYKLPVIGNFAEKFSAS